MQLAFYVVETFGDGVVGWVSMALGSPAVQVVLDGLNFREPGGGLYRVTSFESVVGPKKTVGLVLDAL